MNGDLFRSEVEYEQGQVFDSNSIVIFKTETNKVSSQSIFVFNTNQFKSIISLTTHRLIGWSEAVVADEVEEGWLKEVSVS